MHSQLYTPLEVTIPFEAVTTASARQRCLNKLMQAQARLTNEFVELAHQYPAKQVLSRGRGTDPQGQRSDRDPKLVYRTLENQTPHPLLENAEPSGTCYRIDIRDFGQQVIETTCIRQHEPMKRGKKKPREENERKKRSEMSEDDRKKSVFRSKKLMRHKILMLRPDRMLTLTYRENLTSLEIAWPHFKSFIRMVRKIMPDFQYVAVPEYQKRGAVHFHLAIKGYRDVRILRHLWKKAIKGEGNIHITPPRKGKHEWRYTSLARYMSKYLSKQIDTENMFKRRYSSSQEIGMPKKTVFWCRPGDSIFHILSQVMEKMSKHGMIRSYEVPDANQPIIWMASY